MQLNEIKSKPGTRKDRTRVGRGIGSGKGKTSGSGQKGQKARSGVAIKGFEGGQMPLYRRLPKRGFTNPNGKVYAEVNLGRLQKFIDDKKIDAKKPIDAAALISAGIIRREKDGVRILAKGEIKAKVTLIVTGATKPAIAAVEKAGGKIEIAEPKAEAPKKAAKA